MLTQEKLEEILATFAENLTTAIAEDLETLASDDRSMDAAAKSVLVNVAHVMRYSTDHAYIAKQTVAEVAS